MKKRMYQKSFLLMVISIMMLQLFVPWSSAFANGEEGESDESFTFKDFGFIEDEQIFIVPEDGTYQLMAAGAAGQFLTQVGGYGSLIKGQYELKKGDELRIVVGGTNGYNGGGGYQQEGVLTGGGATHVYVNGELYMQAAGGGAYGYDFDEYRGHGGYGYGYGGSSYWFDSYDGENGGGGGSSPYIEMEYVTSILKVKEFELYTDEEKEQNHEYNNTFTIDDYEIEEDRYYLYYTLPDYRSFWADTIYTLKVGFPEIIYFFDGSGEYVNVAPQNGKSIQFDYTYLENLGTYGDFFIRYNIHNNQVVMEFGEGTYNDFSIRLRLFEDGRYETFDEEGYQSNSISNIEIIEEPLEEFSIELKADVLETEVVKEITTTYIEEGSAGQGGESYLMEDGSLINVYGDTLNKSSENGYFRISKASSFSYNMSVIDNDFSEEETIRFEPVSKTKHQIDVFLYTIHASGFYHVKMAGSAGAGEYKKSKGDYLEGYYYFEEGEELELTLGKKGDGYQNIHGSGIATTISSGEEPWEDYTYLQVKGGGGYDYPDLIKRSVYEAFTPENSECIVFSDSIEGECIKFLEFKKVSEPILSSAPTIEHNNLSLDFSYWENEEYSVYAENHKVEGVWLKKIAEHSHLGDGYVEMTKMPDNFSIFDKEEGEIEGGRDIGKVVSEHIPFTESEQVFRVTRTGVYSFAAFGAQGANHGKFGDLVFTPVQLNEGDIVKIVVGGQNGYNGGGGYQNPYVASGGGATHVYVNDELLIQAAGGGGGGGLEGDYSDYYLLKKDGNDNSLSALLRNYNPPYSQYLGKGLEGVELYRLLDDLNYFTAKGGEIITINEKTFAEGEEGKRGGGGSSSESGQIHQTDGTIVEVEGNDGESGLSFVSTEAIPSDYEQFQGIAGNVHSGDGYVLIKSGELPISGAPYKQEEGVEIISYPFPWITEKNDIVYSKYVKVYNEPIRVDICGAASDSTLADCASIILDDDTYEKHISINLPRKSGGNYGYYSASLDTEFSIYEGNDMTIDNVGQWDKYMHMVFGGVEGVGKYAPTQYSSDLADKAFATGSVPGTQSHSMIYPGFYVRNGISGYGSSFPAFHTVYDYELKEESVNVFKRVKKEEIKDKIVVNGVSLKVDYSWLHDYEYNGFTVNSSTGFGVNVYEEKTDYLFEKNACHAIMQVVPLDKAADTPYIWETDYVKEENCTTTLWEPYSMTPTEPVDPIDPVVPTETNLVLHSATMEPTVDLEDTALTVELGWSMDEENATIVELQTIMNGLEEVHTVQTTEGQTNGTFTLYLSEDWLVTEPQTTTFDIKIKSSTGKWSEPKTVTFDWVDNTPPSFPSNTVTWEEQQAKIVLTITDNHLIDYVILPNSARVTITEKTKEVSYNVGTAGEYIFKAVDISGNEQQITVTVSNAPTEPVEPTNPTEPPVEPTEPVEPTNPTEPPVEPTEPIESEPTQPVYPVPPVKPEEPTKEWIEKEFYESAIYIIERDGWYELTTIGAQGADNGGLGAQTSGKVYLTKGQVLKIDVGREGNKINQYTGGEATRIYIDNVLYLIGAGGGAGINGTDGGTGNGEGGKGAKGTVVTDQSSGGEDGLSGKNGNGGNRATDYYYSIGSYRPMGYYAATGYYENIYEDVEVPLIKLQATEWRTMDGGTCNSNETCIEGTLEPTKKEMKPVLKKVAVAWETMDGGMCDSNESCIEGTLKPLKWEWVPVYVTEKQLVERIYRKTGTKFVETHRVWKHNHFDSIVGESGKGGANFVSTLLSEPNLLSGTNEGSGKAILKEIEKKSK